MGWRRWAGTWRLLALAMPLTIAVVTALTGWWLGLGAAAALLLAAGVLVLGGSIARGLLSVLTPVDVALAHALVLVVRPVVAWVSLLGAPGGRTDRAVIAFFGVRGIGSVYYLAYAFGHADFAPDVVARLWAVTALVVVVSVVLHGAAATPVMDRIDAARRRRAAAFGRTDDVQEVPV